MAEGLVDPGGGRGAGQLGLPGRPGRRRGRWRSTRRWTCARVDAAAERRGLRVAFAADTHLHADFLSGAAQLAARDGAQVLASAAGRPGVPAHAGWATATRSTSAG